MICPRCGRDINKLECACGFSALNDKAVFIGYDSNNQMSAFAHNLNALPKARTDEDGIHLKITNSSNENNLDTAINELDSNAKELQERVKNNDSDDSRIQETDGNAVSGGTNKKHWAIIVSALLIIAATVFVIHGTLSQDDSWVPTGGEGWGRDERELYSNDSQAPYAVFNSIIDNSAVGDDRNFVRIGEANSTEPYSDELQVEPGKEYEVYIYFRNDADPETNSTGYGVATDTRVSTGYPVELKAGEKGMISGIVSWSYVTPENPDNPSDGKVWDEAYITSEDDVSIKIKAASAIIHNGGEVDGEILSTSLFSEKGTPIGYNKLEGTIPGGADYSGYITYTLVVGKKGDTSWGPQDRATYTMEAPAKEPVFNSITNNPTIGDERNFVRIGQINADATDMVDSVELVKGKQYLVYIYYHNNASSTYNDSDHGKKGVAINTRLSTTFPKTVTSEENGVVKATISADNANPSLIWDTAVLTTNEDSVELQYVEGSAKIYNDWDTNGWTLPATLFESEGTLLGLNELNGVVPGCEEYHGVVTYVLEAK